LAKYCMNHQSILYPAAVFQKYRYDLRYKVFADYDLNIKVWGDPSFRQSFHPLSVALYEMTGFSSTTRDDIFIRDKPRLIRQGMGWGTYLRFLLKRWKKKRERADDFF